MQDAIEFPSMLPHKCRLHSHFFQIVTPVTSFPMIEHFQLVVLELLVQLLGSVDDAVGLSTVDLVLEVAGLSDVGNSRASAGVVAGLKAELEGGSGGGSEVTTGVIGAALDEVVTTGGNGDISVVAVGASNDGLALKEAGRGDVGVRLRCAEARFEIAGAVYIGDIDAGGVGGADFDAVDEGVDNGGGQITAAVDISFGNKRTLTRTYK